MMPVEVILGAVAALGTAGTALFGGGLLKQLFSHSNAIAIQKHENANMKELVEKNEVRVRDLELKVSLQNKDIEDFKQHLKKLDMIPEIVAGLRGLSDLIGYLKEQINDLRSERKHTV